MQTTWKVFSSINEAIAGTRGNTQISVGLVRDNMFVEESAEWIATAAVNDFGDWQDGCVVVTNLRVFVAYVDPSLQQTYGNMVDRVPVPRISQMQGGGNLATFAIDGLPYQALALMPREFEALREMLTQTDMTDVVNAGVNAVGNPGTSAQQEDPMAALTKAKELLEAGLITEAEYDAKKEEILKRL